MGKTTNLPEGRKESIEKNCKNSDCFEVVQWPDVQSYMGQPDFAENSQLIDGEMYDKYGDQAYLVNKVWMEKQDLVLFTR